MRLVRLGAVALASLIWVTSSTDLSTPILNLAAGQPKHDDGGKLLRRASSANIRFDFPQGLNDAALHEVDEAGGSLSQLSRGTDWAIKYPEGCRTESRCPRAILESGPVSWLNPGRRNFRWGADVLMASDEVSDGSNVVQKGYSISGTQFKLQVDHLGGLPSCVVAGPIDGVNHIYVAESRKTVANGQWHQLACERSQGVLSLSVDGELKATVSVPPELSIMNNLPLRLGGKSAGQNNDQFHGALDSVYVDIS